MSARPLILFIMFAPCTRFLVQRTRSADAQKNFYDVLSFSPFFDRIRTTDFLEVLRLCPCVYAFPIFLSGTHTLTVHDFLFIYR